MASCVCSRFHGRSITTVNDTLTGLENEAILASCELVARAESKWGMALYRCRECGTLWTEAPFDSGHVLFFYLFPTPPVDDPVRWLNEVAEPLEYDWDRDLKK